MIWGAVTGFIRRRREVGFPLLRQAAGTLFAPGVPATETEPAQGKGIARSTTVLFSVGSIITASITLINQLKSVDPDQGVVNSSIVIILTAAGAIWRRIRTKVATRGAPKG